MDRSHARRHVAGFGKLKKLGYDSVEVPLIDLSLDYAAWGKRLDDLGLERTAVTLTTAADNPISGDAKIRAAGVARLRRAVDCCRAVGGLALSGPYHSAIGEFSGKGPTADEWRWGVESMRQVAETAQAAKIPLTVEYLNRFECYFLNTSADTARFVREVNIPVCRMMYDTFHAHIEEKNVAEAIRAAAPQLGLVHISENDRSTPGVGLVDWKTTFDTLREVGYNGWLIVEAFGMALPGLQAATKIWRRMFESEEQLARDALAFMKREVAKRW